MSNEWEKAKGDLAAKGVIDSADSTLGEVVRELIEKVSDEVEEVTQHDKNVSSKTNPTEKKKTILNQKKKDFKFKGV